jgi:anti-anti-sigma factor
MDSARCISTAPLDLETDREHATTRRADGELRLTTERHGAAAVIHLAGELDIASAPQLIDTIRTLEAPCDCIVLDLSGLTFIDSTGLHLAVDQYKRAARDGFEFVMAGAHGHVLRTLELSGLDVALPIAPDVSSVIGARLDAA